MIRIGIAVGALMLAAQAPAQAQDSTARVERAGDMLVVPVPEGYCTEGPAVDAMRSIMQMQPDLVIARCDAAAEAGAIDVIALKATGERRDRASLSKELVETMPDDALLPDRPADALEARMIETLRDDSTPGASFEAVGMDDVCGYLAGSVIAVLPEAGEHRVGAVGCVASGDGELLFLFHYADGDPAALAASLPRLRAIVLGASHE